MLNRTPKIAHLTSAHTRTDTRIFLKECLSLVKKGDVYLVVADGKGDSVEQGVKVLDVGKHRGRLDRFLRTGNKIYKRAVEINADVYHLHDPELIPMGLKLKKSGYKVIFDAHEDLPKQILGKPYLNKFCTYPISFIVKLYEWWACSEFDGIVTATPYICKKFETINNRCVDINNYPILGELGQEKDWALVESSCCYVGDLSSIRGAKTLIQSLSLTKDKTKLLFAGEIGEPGLIELLQGKEGWKKVEKLGMISRGEVKKLFEKSFAGIVTFYPLPNHIDSQPNKMFEYMSAGLPVIGSFFPLWKEILEENHCGLCVDPTSATQIANAINYLENNKNVAKKMGENGQKAVWSKYNWAVEEQKLFDFYEKVLAI